MRTFAFSLCPLSVLIGQNYANQMLMYKQTIVPTKLNKKENEALSWVKASDFSLKDVNVVLSLWSSSCFLQPSIAEQLPGGGPPGWVSPGTSSGGDETGPRPGIRLCGGKRETCCGPLCHARYSRLSPVTCELERRVPDVAR